MQAAIFCKTGIRFMPEEFVQNMYDHSYVYRHNPAYLCDPDKVEKCQKTMCQHECFMTLHKDEAVTDEAGHVLYIDPYDFPTDVQMREMYIRIKAGQKFWEEERSMCKEDHA